MADISYILDIYNENKIDNLGTENEQIAIPRTSHSLAQLVDTLTLKSSNTFLSQKDVRKKLFDDTDGCIFSHNSDIDQESEDHCASSPSLSSTAAIGTENIDIPQFIPLLPDHSLTRAIGIYI
jgi:hypothetical protein